MKTWFQNRRMKHKKVYRKGTNCLNKTLQDDDLEDDIIDDNDEIDDEDDYGNSNHNNSLNFNLNFTDRISGCI